MGFWSDLKKAWREAGTTPAKKPQATSVPSGKPGARPTTRSLVPRLLVDVSVGEVEVSGESYRSATIGTLMRELGLPEGGVVYREAQLVPEPRNRHDRNAVMVLIDGHHVGYEPAEFAEFSSPRYQQLMRQGVQPMVLARVWARRDGVWRARVSLLFSGERGEDEVDYAEQARAQREREELWRRQEIAGAVRGVSYGSHRPQIDQLKRDGRYDEALVLLRECIGAAERVAALDGSRPAWWPTEQAAIVMRKVSDLDGEVAVLESFVGRCGDEVPIAAARRLSAARDKVARARFKHPPGHVWSEDVQRDLDEVDRDPGGDELDRA